MVLEFGNQLFKRNNVTTEEESLLKERWGQGGSNLVSASGTDDSTIYTVTSGKTLYISSITYSSQNASGNNYFYLRDGGAAGAVKLQAWAGIQYQTYTVVFDAPLKFITSVYLDTNDDIHLTFSGWEE